MKFSVPRNMNIDEVKTTQVTWENTVKRINQLTQVNKSLLEGTKEVNYLEHGRSGH